MPPVNCLRSASIRQVPFVRLTAVRRAPTLPPWGEIDLAPPPTGTAARILDAAHARFVRQGITATTMAQIADDAGISRVWLYRFFDNRDDIVRGLMSREVQAFVAAVVAELDLTASATDTVLRAADLSIARLRHDPLLRHLLRAEPEAAAPFLVAGLGALWTTLVDLGASYLRRRAGMSPAQARAVTDALLRVLSSIVVDADAGLFDDARRRRAYLERIIPALVPR